MINPVLGSVCSQGEVLEAISIDMVVKPKEDGEASSRKKCMCGL
jgi:hypothetical protein